MKLFSKFWKNLRILHKKYCDGEEGVIYEDSKHLLFQHPEGKGKAGSPLKFKSIEHKEGLNEIRTVKEKD